MVRPLERCRSVRRPPYPDTPMSIAVGLLLGLVLGATAVWALLVRPAVEERRRLSAAVRERELRAVGAETRLEALEATFDDRLAGTIKDLSAQALRENSAAFADQAMGRLDQYVKPLKDTLEKVETNVQTLERARQQAFGALRQELETVREGQERLRSETGNLATALRAPHVRGR